MEVQEFDNALTELETRVDRLRALYENWFRGYEKTEPSVARKDVERRVYGLRKELPRNTALRFRYHQLYQRFSTLANYWQRTARQVEEGTYRMQVQRMRRRKDEQLSRSMVPQAEEGAEHEGPAHKSYELNLDETLDVGSLLDDFELDQVANAIDAPGPYAEPQTTRPVARFRLPGAAPSKTPPERPSLTLDALQSFGGIPAIMAPPAANDSQSTSPPLRGSLPMPTVPVPRRPSAEEITGRPPPSIAAKPTLASALEERLLAGSKGQASGAAGATTEPPAQSAPQKPEPHGRPPQPANSAALVRPASPAGIVPPARPAIPAGQPAPSPGRPGPAAQVPPGARPAVPVPTATTTAPRPPVPPPPAPRVPAPPAQTSAARAPTPAQSAPAVLARPPAPAVPARVPAAAIPSSGAGISDQQIRRIYDDYVAARRKNNEGDVRYETLASSINKMLPDLQKRHQGKRIDFEIVLKDGRVGLKPKAT